MKVIKTVLEMMNISNLERAQGKNIRLIPTMGALHRGHAILIEAAIKRAASNQQSPGPTKDTDVGSCRLGRIIVVSIFVNPLQFNNYEDFSKYPNTLQQDLDICEELGVDYVFAPELKEMYPDVDSKFDRCTVYPVDHLASILEGESRPGHFRGMLTVVCKLLNITKPHEAFFGEKDYQQLLLVTKMSQDLNMGVSIVPVAIVRDTDMLPLSSRNVRLTYQQRLIAPIMHKILLDARQAIKSFYKLTSTNLDGVPKSPSSILASSMIVTLGFLQISGEDESIQVDYLQLRCSKDLSEISYNQELCCFDCNRGCMTQQVTGKIARALETRLLISVIVGNVRLLDNIEIELNI